MKKMFSLLSQMCSNGSKKYILFLLAIIVLPISGFAGDHYYATLEVKVAEQSATVTGSGTVYVNSPGTFSEKQDSEDNPGGERSFNVGYTPDDNSYFEKWIPTDGVTLVGNNTAKMNASQTKDNSTYGTLTAVFQRIVGVGANSNFTIIHYPGVGSTKTIPITVNGGTTELNVTQTADFFTCQTEKLDNAGTNWNLIITNNADAAIGSQATITLTTAENKTNSVTFTLKEGQVISLVGAPHGTYTATQTNLNINHPLSSNTTDTVSIPINDGDGFAFKFEFTPATGYRLNRLRAIGDGIDTCYYDDIDDGIYEISCTFTESVVVQPEFIPTNYAQFIILGADTTIHYNDLNRAISEAQRLGKSVVSVYKKGNILVTTEQKDNAIVTKTIKNQHQDAVDCLLPSGTYTIPSGITLLVPGVGKSALEISTVGTDIVKTIGYEYCFGNVTADDFTDRNPTPKCVCKLVLESGTTIEVGGNISVYSCMTTAQGYTARPTGYGQIHLQDDSHIQIHSGGVLHVTGYVTGDPQKTSVVAKNGAKVYEALQFTDWRGGTAMTTGGGSGLVNNSYEVFPIGQYYIQNIETLLQVEYGATEYLSSAVDAGVLVPVTAALLTKRTEGEDLGLFAIGDSTIFQKYYDATTDRLKINFIGLANGAKAKLSYVYMEVKVLFFDYSLDSRNYVLPINNNIDIIVDNVTIDIPFKSAFLAGSTLEVTNTASMIIKNEMYVYDKELNVQPADEARGYFASTSKALCPIQYTAYHGKAPGVRTAEATRYPTQLKDASLIIDGTLTMADAGILYTTIYDASAITSGVTDTSEEALIKVFGANITSNSNGIINYNLVGTLSYTNQINQSGTTVEYVTNIPVNNARLRNADGTFSGGENAQQGETYMYLNDKWIIPEADLGEPQGNNFYLTLPKDSVQNVVCPVVVNGVTITAWNVAVNGSQFTQNAAYNYDATAGTLTIPVKYTRLNKHNANTNPYEGDITVSITYCNLLNETKTKTIHIPLTAIEDYTPNFRVAIAGQTFNNGDTCTMAGYVNTPTIADVLITPAEKNVAQSLATDAWTNSIAAPFTFAYGETSETHLSGAKLTYTPTAVGSNEGVLTLTATYTDATPQEVDSTITIYINASAQRAISSLAFQPELATAVGDTIYQGQTIDAIFANMGNSNAISFTFDNEATHELVSIAAKDGNYSLTAKEVDEITEARTIKIVAMQETDAAMFGDTLTIQLTVLPPVTWNWANLYFGSTTTTPPVDVPDTHVAWTLTKKTDEANLITSLNPDPTNGYVATVGAPADATQTYTAEFTFRQGGYTKVFTSNIFADPRVVDYCVDNERTFKAVTVAAVPVTSVAFADGVVSFASTAEQTTSWTIALVGVPDKLTFIPTVSENAWLIEEYNGTAWSTTYKLDTITANTTFTHSLLPSTQQIRITYAAGAVSTGKLSSVCVSKLEGVKANTNKVYMPVAKDADGNIVPTTRKVVLYSVSASDLNISLSNGNISSDVTTIPANTTAYTRQEITLTNNADSEDVVYLYVKDNSNTTLLTLPIRPFEFRQGLPISLATDEPAERYHFLTTPSASDTWANNTANVVWNETNRAIVFQNPGSTTATRSVTIAFEGAADYIQFHTSKTVLSADWYIEESTGGSDWREAVDSIRLIINEGKGINQPLSYNTRYVRITYKGADLSKFMLTNLIIEGKPHLMVNPTTMSFSDDTEQTKMGIFTMTAINLNQIRIVSDNPNNFKILYDASDLTLQVNEFTATASAYPNALGTNKVGTIQLGVAWQAINTIDDGKLFIYNDDNDSILAVIDLLGAKGLLVKDNADNTGLYTGIPDGSRDIDGDGVVDKYTYHGQDYTDYPYHEVDLTNTFADDGTAIFDYLFIYGETKTTDYTTNITAPKTGGQIGGSNASTPYYIYKKTTNTSGKYVAYQFVGSAEANTSDKAAIGDVIIKDKDTTYIDVQDSLRVYITGFAPYATTGYTKNDEGVFFFRGKHGAKLDIYLEDCHIFSRNKTQHGNAFYGNKEGGQTFSEDYARGSGGVLVFENTDSQEQLSIVNPFEVNIHTIGDNLLKSNYGCFFILLESMKAYQISAPIHVHLNSAKHVRTTKTTLNFDDKWPTAVDANNAITATKRTNGYLGLKKQSNNAPSIDLGNPNTVVNFNGGRIELQNAQIVSDNYKTTLAISYRSGEYGGDDVGIKLSYGIGTDSVGGTVYFNDGTTTVEPMYVKPEYRQYYLMDVKLTTTGDTVRDDNGDIVYSDSTSCLRTPKNTYVYGGSHCFMRACQHVTSKGGAPKDGPNGSFLGQYVYTMQDGDTKNEAGLATSIQFPENLTEPNLQDYYDARNYTYGLNSVAPDANNQLYFWIPDGYGGVTAEQDKFISIWKACMTEIRAGLAGVLEGGIGGDTPIEPNEEVKYFLYCQLDQNIHDVISAGTGTGDDKEYSYKAPVAVPPVASSYFDNAKYTYIGPTHVSDSVQYQVLSDTTYTITDKVYYVTTATADIWQTFTAPFDVKNIWVVETYPEEKLMEVGDGTRDTILISQAHHNADFAAFFAVAMAIGTTDSFEEIYDSYIKWAKGKDQELGFYNGTDDYTLRGKQILEPYYGGNWRTANFYLNHNNGNWQLEDGQFKTQWNVITQSEFESGTLLRKGETYSMLFPYLTLNGENLSNRDEWDYWSGKLLIFESTDAPQTINGRDFLNESKAGHIFSTTPASNEIIVTGNSTFARMETMKSNAYIYFNGYPTIGQESFYPNTEENEDGDFVEVSTPTTIWPTTAFLYGEVPANAQGMPARRIMRTGEIIYDQNPDEDDNDNTQTGIPTVGGGNDLYITTIANGINIAVAAPQYVRVISSTGALLFQGEVQTSVDVALPTAGVYVIAGETEAHKILY